MESEQGHGLQGQESSLHLEAVKDEDVALRQIGNLKEWTPSVWGITLSIPPVMETPRVIDTIRQLGLSWSDLQSFTLHCVSPGWRIGQTTLGALAELISLQSLTLDGGTLVAGLDWHVLTGLKSLTELRVSPFRGRGITDADLLQTQTNLPAYLAAVRPERKAAPTSPLGLPALTGLRKLEFRGCADMLSDEGLACLTTLTNLHTLCILPLGILVTAQGVQGLCSSLSRLETLVTGVEQSGQVDVLKGALPEAGGSVRSLGLAVGDPEPELPGLLSTCTLCLLSNLTSLRLPHLKAEDSAFMVALGALTSLSQLCLTVAAARPDATPPFVINLSTLSQLRQLQHLEVAVVGGRRVGLPISLKLLSCCALSWPRLSRLLLTCMTTPTPQIGAVMPGTASSSGLSQGKQGESMQGQGRQQAPTKAPPSQGPQLQPRVSVGSAVQSIGWFVQPECLDILDAFSNLTHLSLLAPYPEEPSATPSTSEVTASGSLHSHSKTTKHVSSAARGLWWLWGGDGGESEEHAHVKGWQSSVGPTGWWGHWPAWAGGWTSSASSAGGWTSTGRASSGSGGAAKDGGQRGGHGQQGDSIKMLEGLPLVPLAMHRLPPKLQHLAVERAVLWHPDAPLPTQLQPSDGGLVISHKAASGNSNSNRGPMPCLKSLELAQCEVSDDLAKLIFAASPGLNLLELVEVRSMSAASLRSLSELISLHHLSVHQRSTSKPKRSTSGGQADSNSSSSRHSEGANGVGSLLWRMLGYQSSSKSAMPEDSKGTPPEPTKLRPRDLWPVVCELTGLRTLQWDVWEDSKEPSQPPTCPDKQRTRVRVAESRHILAHTASALPLQPNQRQRQQQQHTQQQLQRRRYWQQQCQQHLQQQLQAQHSGLPNSTSSPLLSPASLASQHGLPANGSGHAQQRRSMSSSRSQVPSVPPSGQLSSADLAAAGVASEAVDGGRPFKCGSWKSGQVPLVPPRQLPSQVALGTWASAESLGALLQSLPDLQMAYIDLREAGGHASEADYGPARPNTGSLVRSSSTPSHAPVASPASAAASQLRPLPPLTCQLSVSGFPPTVLQDVYTGRLSIAVDE